MCSTIAAFPIPTRKITKQQKKQQSILPATCNGNLNSSISDIPTTNVVRTSNEFEFEELFSSGCVAKTDDFADHSLDEESCEKSFRDQENSHESYSDEDSQENNASNRSEDDDVLFPSSSKVNLNDFVLLKVVGKGGYGKVYQARKKETGEIFAIKALRKDFLIRTNNVEYTKTEKDILRNVRHPFIVQLYYAFQNECKVYLVMDFVNGGQILFHLREQAMFSEQLVRFYSAQVILAVEHLHLLDVIHRDLKPENILINQTGYIALTDFGFAKEEMTDGSKTRTFCGTIEYMAPEMISGSGYGKAADWWSVGILIFDMLTGGPPFRSKNDGALQKKIMTEKLRLPVYLSAEAHSIIKGLLNRDDKKRLGSGKTGAKEIKAHPFFKGINWKKLERMEMEPPFRPNVPNGTLDVSNFDVEFLNQPVTESPPEYELTQSQESLFRNFSFVRSCTPDVSAMESESDQNPISTAETALL